MCTEAVSEEETSPARQSVPAPHRVLPGAGQEVQLRRHHGVPRRPGQGGSSDRPHTTHCAIVTLSQLDFLPCD